MRRERNIGKRKRNKKISLYFVQSLGNEKEEETREKAKWAKMLRKEING